MKSGRYFGRLIPASFFVYEGIITCYPPCDSEDFIKLVAPLNSNFITVIGSGGYVSDATKTALQTAYNALPSNCLRTGILSAGDVGGLIIVKADNSYGVIVRIGYRNITSSVKFSSINVYNGTWGDWIDK